MVVLGDKEVIFSHSDLLMRIVQFDLVWLVEDSPKLYESNSFDVFLMPSM